MLGSQDFQESPSKTLTAGGGRRWAAKIIRGEAEESSLPLLDAYLQSAQLRVAAQRKGVLFGDVLAVS